MRDLNSVELQSVNGGNIVDDAYEFFTGNLTPREQHVAVIGAAAGLVGGGFVGGMYAGVIAVGLVATWTAKDWGLE